MFQRFCDAVRGGLSDRKVPADPSAALVVGAVDRAGGAIEPVKGRTRDSLCPVKLILIGITVKIGGGEMLDDIPAEVNVDDLHPPADTQDGFSCPDKRVQYQELRPVQSRIHKEGALICLTEEVRMDIAAARKHKMAAAGDVSGV